MADRAAVFIDAGYLEKVLDIEFDRPRVDFRKLVDAICPDAPLLRAYYYNCPPFVSATPTQDERGRQARADRFYAALGRIPRFEIRKGRLGKRSCRNCGHERFEQKRVDILLSVDLVRLSSKQGVSQAAIIAGDSDFIPAIQVAKDEGTEVHLWHGGPENQPHRDLLEVCDELHRIDQALVDRAAR